MNHLPPCCASCSELDPQKRACRLLARPTLEHRQRLLSMPCDVQRLVRLRFRGHGEDVASRALSAWVEPSHDPNTIAWSFGEASRDARIWLSAWPFRELARAAVQQKLAELPPRSRPMPASDAPPPSPVLFARIAASLARVAQLDAVGFAMLLDTLNGEFQPAAWRDALGAMDAAIAERRLLAIYRFAALFFDAIEAVPEADARAALVARTFTPGDPTDADALLATRGALGGRALALPEWRSRFLRGAAASIAALMSDDALGASLDDAATRALRRALKLDDDMSADLDAASEALAGALARHARAGSGAGGDDHVDPDRLAALAAGTIDAPGVAPIARHLFVCADRRCNTLLRWEVGGRDAARKLLAGPMNEPARAEPFGRPHASPHVLYCRDVLWQAFTQMAQAEGRSIDELVEDAMARYQSVREIVAPDPPKKRSSAPPPNRPSGVPMPPARKSSAPPPPDRPPSAPPVAASAPLAEAPPRPTSPSAPPPAPDGRATPTPPTVVSPALAPPRVPNLAAEPRVVIGSHATAARTSSANEPTPMIATSYGNAEADRIAMLDRVADRLASGVDVDEAPPERAEPAAEPGPTPITIPAPRAWNDDEPPAAPRATVNAETMEPAENLAALASDFSELEDTSPKMNFTPLSPPLFVEYAGRRYHVATMRFVIGRERNTCHLVLPDSNVSRQHAIVEWANGNYWLVDLGSTNGVGCGGHRIHRKQIVEGDRFDICGHGLMFSFRLQ